MMSPLPCGTLNYPENIEKIKCTRLGSNPGRVHQRPMALPPALACLIVTIINNEYNMLKQMA